MSGFSRTKGTKGSMGTRPKLAAPFSKDWPLLFKSSQTTKTTIHPSEANPPTLAISGWSSNRRKGARSFSMTRRGMGEMTS
jgi:hypothetical protein